MPLKTQFGTDSCMIYTRKVYLHYADTDGRSCSKLIKGYYYPGEVPVEPFSERLPAPGMRQLLSCRCGAQNWVATGGINEYQCDSCAKEITVY
ncbi:hypothetical protein KJI99_005006 [Salmonella enterica subsp. enterica serovar Anecho]|nr:hypothetical protein [Salmonella enterica subsp. enterica serovar Anecho]